MPTPTGKSQAVSSNVCEFVPLSKRREPPSPTIYPLVFDLEEELQALTPLCEEPKDNVSHGAGLSVVPLWLLTETDRLMVGSKYNKEDAVRTFINKGLERFQAHEVKRFWESLKSEAQAIDSRKWDKEDWLEFSNTIKSSRAFNYPIDDMGQETKKHYTAKMTVKELSTLGGAATCFGISASQLAQVAWVDGLRSQPDMVLNREMDDCITLFYRRGFRRLMRLYFDFLRYEKVSGFELSKPLRAVMKEIDEWVRDGI